jgi:adenosylcobyric acid synthase
MAPVKHLSLRRGRHLASDTPLSGYEIHVGGTEGPDSARPWVEIEGRPEGASSADGRVQGCYLHGLFASDAFRRAYLAGFRAESSLDFEGGVEAALEALADHVERFMDVDRLLELAEEVTEAAPV